MRFLASRLGVFAHFRFRYTTASTVPLFVRGGTLKLPAALITKRFYINEMQTAGVRAYLMNNIYTLFGVIHYETKCR